MEFRNERHRQVFWNASQRIKEKDNVNLAALYLLTADFKLWRQARKQMGSDGKLLMYRVWPEKSTEESYTLFCCAKDLLYGANHLAISDLADGELISPKLYKLISNAVEIKRYGIKAITSRAT